MRNNDECRAIEETEKMEEEEIAETLSEEEGEDELKLTPREPIVLVEPYEVPCTLQWAGDLILDPYLHVWKAQQLINTRPEFFKHKPLGGGLVTLVDIASDGKTGKAYVDVADVKSVNVTIHTKEMIQYADHPEVIVSDEGWSIYAYYDWLLKDEVQSQTIEEHKAYIARMEANQWKIDERDALAKEVRDQWEADFPTEYTEDTADLLVTCRGLPVEAKLEAIQDAIASPSPLYGWYTTNPQLTNSSLTYPESYPDFEVVGLDNATRKLTIHAFNPVPEFMRTTYKVSFAYRHKSNNEGLPVVITSIVGMYIDDMSGFEEHTRIYKEQQEVLAQLRANAAQG